jgi:hypothetical protein
LRGLGSDGARALATVRPWLREPNAWSALLVLMLAVIVVWQHPISRAIGTAAPRQAVTAMQSLPVTATVPMTPVLRRGTPWGQAGRSARHAARDPFHPLIAGSGSAAAPVVGRLRNPLAVGPITPAGQPQPQQAAASGAATPRTPRTPRTQQTAPARQAQPPLIQPQPQSSTQPPAQPQTHKQTPRPSEATASCPSIHVVRSGESLWSISQGLLMGGHRFSSVTSAWHALCAANRSQIGSNPSLLLVGQHLCLPPP